MFSLTVPPANHETFGIQGRGSGLVSVALAFAAIASLTVIGRILSRTLTNIVVASDDYCIVASMVFSWAFTIIVCVGVSHGYGNTSGLLTTADLKQALQAFYACQIAYKITLNLTKISILLLYYRVFEHRLFRALILRLAYLIGLFAIGTTFATIFQCVPVARNWDRSIPGRCIDKTAFWYVHAGCSIATDLVILVAPMPIIRRLKLSWDRRKWLYIIFSLGAFVCITSIVRMTVLRAGSTSHDLNHDTFKSTIWTAVECNTAIICASLPMLKEPMLKCYKKRSRIWAQQNGAKADFLHPLPPSQSPSEEEEPSAFPGAWRVLTDSNGVKFLVRRKDVKVGEFGIDETKAIIPDVKTVRYLMRRKALEATGFGTYNIRTAIPEIYKPKGCDETMDVITKTTDIDIRFSCDLEALDPAVREHGFGVETIIGPGPSRAHCRSV